MIIREIFRKLWITAAIFQHPPYFFCLFLSLSTFAIAIAIVSSYHSSVYDHSEPEGWGSPRGYRPAHSRSGPIDFTRAILSDYFIYSAARSGAVYRTSGFWTGASLRGGKGGENGLTEGARRGNFAPISGSPVAPSRTCRLFPRRDSRSPHLSSVRPASPKPSSSFPRSVFDPLTTDGTRVHCGYGAEGRARLFIFRYFWFATRDTLRAHYLRRTRLVDIRKNVMGQQRKNGRVLNVWID